MQIITSDQLPFDKGSESNDFKLIVTNEIERFTLEDTL